MDRIMKHNKALSLIKQHLQGQFLDDDTLAEVMKHITNCHQCIREIDALIHEQAMGLITKHLLDRSLDINTLMAVKQHIANCRQCIDEFDATLKIIGAVTGEATSLKEQTANLLTCEECLQQLPGYAEIEDKQEANKAYPQVRKHLDSCKACQEMLEELHNMLEEEEAGLYSGVPGEPILEDLAATAPTFWLQQPQGIRALSSKIKVRVTKEDAVFYDLPAWLQSQQYATYDVYRDVYREDSSSDVSRQNSEEISQEPSKIEVLEVPDEDTNRKCKLILSVNSKGNPELRVKFTDAQDKPLPRTSCILESEKGHIIDGGRRSDAPGEEDLRLRTGNLFILIKYQDITWKIPIEVESERVEPPKLPISPLRGESMEEITEYHVTKSEDKFEFEIRRLPTEFDVSEQKADIPVNAETLERVNEAIAEIARKTNEIAQVSERSGDISKELKQLGILMYDLSIPEEIKPELKNLSTPLVIRTNQSQLPWELLHDGGEFLGIKRPVARAIWTRVGRIHNDAPVLRQIRTSILIISDPTGQLPQARIETKNLIQSLPDTIDFEVVSGEDATVAEVLLMLNSSKYNVIHYSGDVGLDTKKKSYYLKLADGKLFASDIKRGSRGQPLVFVNGCSSSAENPGTEGIARAFLDRGASGFIGTLWPVLDEGAQIFATHFYRAILRGTPLGEALRLARKKTKEDRPYDATWASFVLYGNPYTRIIKPIDLDDFSPDAQQAFHYALQEARNLKHDYIDTPHIFIGLLRVTNGFSQIALKQQGLKPEAIQEVVRIWIKTDENVSEQVQEIALVEECLTPESQNLLSEARKEAESESSKIIEEKHLFKATIKNIGGKLREVLEKTGLDFYMLSSTLFIDGRLNREKVGSTAAQVIDTALTEAVRMGYDSVEVPHFFISLIQLEDGYTQVALRQHGLEPNPVGEAIRISTPLNLSLTTKSRLEPITSSFSRKVLSILYTAEKEAMSELASEISEKHLLIAFIKLGGGVTFDVLKEMGVDFDEMLSDIRNGIEKNVQRVKTPLLNQLGRDLTLEAQEGRIGPIIGREKETERVVQILAWKDKNNPLLLGDAGVGKTAIVEGVAQLIAEGKVPEHLKGKRIIELRAEQMVQGTRFRGDFEERMAQIKAEASNDDVILFIDEIHTIAGAGQAGDSIIDAGDILKPALARGEITCIGATTHSEFRRTIEKDAALERRFQPVNIEEPSPEETYEILKAIKPRFEADYNVTIEDEALHASVKLSIAHLPERRLPDKARELLVEACAKASVGDKKSWALQGPVKKERDVIDAQAIAEIISRRTGKPIAKITESEQTKLLNLEQSLKRRIIGQDEAISIVAESIRVGRVGLKGSNRPLGVFLFVGPSGVGKTSLAQALSIELLGSEREMIRLDMSEFMEEHSVSKLIGSAPGYVGYGEEGQLTGKLRKKPHTIVLLDEIEKAHSKVFNLFLQLFDEGRLTDGQGRTVDGKNAIFIMTSNAATEILNKPKFGFRPEEAENETDIRQRVMAKLKEIFQQEFLNRIDKIIIFKHLTPEHAMAIVRLKLEELAQRLAERYEIQLQYEGAIEFICREGFSKISGARNIERVIEEQLMGRLSAIILQETPPKTIRVREEEGKLICA